MIRRLLLSRLLLLCERIHTHVTSFTIFGYFGFPVVRFTPAKSAQDTPSQVPDGIAGRPGRAGGDHVGRRCWLKSLLGQGQLEHGHRSGQERRRRRPGLQRQRQTCD